MNRIAIRPAQETKILIDENEPLCLELKGL